MLKGNLSGQRDFGDKFYFNSSKLVNMGIRIHVLISGRVQGVFFRSNTKTIADNLGIGGWVRNLPDGRVEVIAEGEKDRVDRFIEFLKKGPTPARVDNVEIETQDYKGEFQDFSIRY